MDYFRAVSMDFGCKDKQIFDVETANYKSKNAQYASKEPIDYIKPLPHARCCLVMLKKMFRPRKGFTFGAVKVVKSYAMSMRAARGKAPHCHRGEYACAKGQATW